MNYLYSLIEEYRNTHDKNILKEIILEYMPILETIADIFAYTRNIEEDEALSLAVIGAISALHKKIDKGVNIVEFMNDGAREEIMKELNKEDNDLPIISLDEYNSNHNNGEEEYYIDDDDILFKSFQTEKLNQVLSTLSEKEKKIIKDYFIEGKKLREIKKYTALRKLRTPDKAKQIIDFYYK